MVDPETIWQRFTCYAGFAMPDEGCQGRIIMNDKNASAQGSPSRTHLFTLRIWRETAAQGRLEIRGKVQHVLTGEVQFFRDWATMEEFLATQLEEMEGGSAE